ncbi:olfactory receptor 8H2-like [Etheostoma cragini]|uniref:olfactory receptor 8H2-like n=1 Tax=Etheostoma cragini TaxID=417921 RepID=UPI00155EF075|nr:olfactory receptor 8H2-like [Etheostoma cragini]
MVRLPHCDSKLKYTFCEYAALIRTTCIDPNNRFNLVSIVSFCMLFVTFFFICLTYFWIIIFVKISSNSDKIKMSSTCLSHLIVVSFYYCPLFITIVFTRLGVVLNLETRQGLTIGSIVVHPLLNPLVYCLRTKEIQFKIIRIFKKV